MDTVYMISIVLISIGSVFLNILLVNQRNYYKSGEQSALQVSEFHRLTADYYKKQFDQALDIPIRH